MALLELNRTEIGRARAAYAQQRDGERQARARVHAAQAEFDALRRGGADARVLARAQAQLDELAAGARDSVAATRERLRGIRGLADALLAQRDPALLFQALDAKHPVLLMPVSIQTRYDDATTRLMIRIYPDVLHAVQHAPGLTPKEVGAAARYWAQRFASPADTESPWQELSRVCGPMRAAYLVRTVVPTNLAQIGDAAAPQRKTRRYVATSPAC